MSPKTAVWSKESEVITLTSGVSITFVDKGVSYNPLQDNELDVENHIKKRQVGGLGIFMTKKLMDKMTYEYRNNENRLTLFKCLK